MIDNKTRIKQVDEKMLGAEMTFNPLNSDQTNMIKALNYYSYRHDAAKSREWALLWILEHQPDLHKTLLKARDFDFENRGFICRMMELGYCLSEKQELQHHQFFIKLANKIVANTKTDDPIQTPKIEIKKPVSTNGFLCVLDNAIQDMLEGKPYEIKATNNRAELSQLINHCEQNLQEIRDNSDGYIPQTARKLKTIFTEYKDYAEKSLAALMSHATRMKAPVKATAINPAKMCKLVKYAKAFPELKLRSIAPTGIIGGKKLYVYDTVTRRLRSYINNADAGFMFSGTSLRNFDPIKSTAKTVRNPEAFFAQFVDGIMISDLHKAYKALTTTESPVSGRFNENLILLKAS